MILSDRAIQEAVRDKKLIIDPAPPPEQYNTTSVDLRLGRILKIWDKIPLGLSFVVDYDDVKIQTLSKYAIDAPLDHDGCFTLKPQQFMLGQTLEKIGLPLDSRLAARVEGRSSLARLGVVVHLTAPTIHADFGGTVGSPITLEIFNMGPFHIKIEPGVSKICQIIVERVEGAHGGAAPSQFRDQRDPLGRG